MSFDRDSEESRRNTTIAISVAVAAVTMVALLYWLFSSLTGPALAVAPAAITSTATPSGTPVPANNATTATAPPTIASWTPTTTFSLPPPEQPTMTAPAQAQTAAQPSPPAPAPAPPPPPAPGISNVNLQCSKADRRGVTAKLSFTTTTKIDVLLAAGDQVQHKSAGPGDVSMSASGRGPEICFAKVGDQTVGPVPAG